MIPKLNAIIGEATNLTRRYKLMEATHLIRKALAPHFSGTPTNSEAGESPSPPNNLNHTPKLPVEHGNSSRSGSWRSSRGFDARATMPLAEVVRILRVGRMDGGLTRPQRQHRVPPVPEGAEFLTRSFVCHAGTRAYKIYLPRRPTDELPLLVMLHGCTQDPDDFALGTRMNELAEEVGFVVAYPWQAPSANPSSCWNWFQPKDCSRGSGEAAIIAGLTKEIVAEYRLNPRRVFVAGLSAGGAMATIMGATYPDVFAAVGVHSGLPAHSATDVVSAFAAMRGDGPASPRRSERVAEARVRTIIFQGSADATVHASNATKILEGTRRASDTSKMQSGSIAGRGYDRTTVHDVEGLKWLEQWILHEAGHAWSGGSVAGSYTEATGPDASREMVRFFLER